MKIDNKAFIKIYKNYYFLNLKTIKLSNEKIKLFTILK